MERKALEQKLTGFFEELHMHPELSYEEYETTERIKRELAAAGIEILQIPLKTGVTAIVRGAFEYQGQKCSAASRAYIPSNLWPVVKDMLVEWERKHPGRTESIFRSLQNVIPSQLADRNLFDFTSLKIDENATPRFLDVVNL